VVEAEDGLLWTSKVMQLFNYMKKIENSVEHPSELGLYDFYSLPMTQLAAALNVYS
jgi:hypothetical protein